MRRFTCLAVVLSICFAGCAKEYQPPPESIPDIKPGRGSPGGEGGASPAGGKKATGGAALAVPK